MKTWSLSPAVRQRHPENLVGKNLYCTKCFTILLVYSYFGFALAHISACTQHSHNKLMIIVAMKTLQSTVSSLSSPPASSLFSSNHAWLVYVLFNLRMFLSTTSISSFCHQVTYQQTGHHIACCLWLLSNKSIRASYYSAQPSQLEN